MPHSNQVAFHELGNAFIARGVIQQQELHQRREDVAAPLQRLVPEPRKAMRTSDLPFLCVGWELFFVVVVVSLFVFVCVCVLLVAGNQKRPDTRVVHCAMALPTTPAPVIPKCEVGCKVTQ